LPKTKIDLLKSNKAKRREEPIVNTNFTEKVEKCLEWIAVKNANSASVVCFYEPEIPKGLENMVQEKYNKIESQYHIKKDIK